MNLLSLCCTPLTAGCPKTAKSHNSGMYSPGYTSRLCRGRLELLIPAASATFCYWAAPGTAFHSQLPLPLAAVPRSEVLHFVRLLGMSAASDFTRWRGTSLLLSPLHCHCPPMKRKDLPPRPVHQWFQLQSELNRNKDSKLNLMSPVFKHREKRIQWDLKLFKQSPHHSLEAAISHSCDLQFDLAVLTTPYLASEVQFEVSPSIRAG